MWLDENLCCRTTGFYLLWISVLFRMCISILVTKRNRSFPHGCDFVKIRSFDVIFVYECDNRMISARKTFVHIQPSLVGSRMEQCPKRYCHDNSPIVTSPTPPYDVICCSEEFHVFAYGRRRTSYSRWLLSDFHAKLYILLISNYYMIYYVHKFKYVNTMYMILLSVHVVLSFIQVFSWIINIFHSSLYTMSLIITCT